MQRRGAVGLSIVKRRPASNAPIGCVTSRKPRLIRLSFASNSSVRLLVDHTVYECPSCQERFLGERRCPDCHLFARAVGLGGSCPDCETVILLADLLELEGMAPA